MELGANARDQGGAKGFPQQIGGREKQKRVRESKSDGCSLFSFVGG